MKMKKHFTCSWCTTDTRWNSLLTWKKKIIMNWDSWMT